MMTKIERGPLHSAYMACDESVQKKFKSELDLAKLGRVISQWACFNCVLLYVFVFSSIFVFVLVVVFVVGRQV